MEIFKFKMHSLVDVITNSSTVIYTYSEGCVKPLKELIDEFAKVMGLSVTADDMFHIGVFADRDTYTNWFDNIDEDEYNEIPASEGKLMKDLDYTEQNEYIDGLIVSIVKGEQTKPDWMTSAEEYDGDYGYTSSTTVMLIPKEPQYVNLAKKFSNLIYSTDHEATRDG